MTIGIRGRGLIGGSFELTFQFHGHEVLDLKGATAETIRRCEVVVVCLPPLLVAPWIREHADDFAPGTIVTDAAGVKGVVMDALADLMPHVPWTFIGGHPMAGKEVGGLENAEVSLFLASSMILTPFPKTDPQAVRKLSDLMRSIGFARVVLTTPEHHDEMIAYTSQLAHVVSSAYIRDELATNHVGFSAGSFQDMTRVATVDPDMWTDLFLSNREELDGVLTRLIERLTGYRDAIRRDDAENLRGLLAEGRRMKNAVSS